MSTDSKICDAIELVDSAGNKTTLDQIGFTNTLAGIYVQWQQINNLETATSALVFPDASNILAVNNTFEANDNYVLKTRTAVLSAPPLVEPSLTLTNITTGDNSVLTTQTLTLTEIVNTNSAILYGNGSLVLNDVGNGSVLQITPDSGLNINVLPFPSSKYVTLDAYNGLGIVDGANTASISSTSIILNNTTTAEALTINNASISSNVGSIALTSNLDLDITSVQGLLNIISTNDDMTLTSGIGITERAEGGNIELIPFNDGITTNGIVRISKDNSLLGDGFLTAGTIDISNDVIGSNISPQLTITNLNASVGQTIGVPSISYYKNGRDVVNNDRIGDQYFYANSLGTKFEFARVEVVARNAGTGNEDGSMSFWTLLNGTPTEFMRINGADADNNFLRPIDMNGSAINSSSGNMSISASSSTGTGNITLTPKATGNLILNNLPTSSAGLPTGAVWNNLGVLSIAP